LGFRASEVTKGQNGRGGDASGRIGEKDTASGAGRNPLPFGANRDVWSLSVRKKVTGEKKCSKCLQGAAMQTGKCSGFRAEEKHALLDLGDNLDDY